MRIHFIGIGGIGISGLAQLCQARGDIVSGSDSGETKIFEVLQSSGINLIESFHDRKNITSDLDLVVYSEAIPQRNVERVAAQDLGIKTQTYFEFLGEISKNYRMIAVAGTHGKTTTTGLLTSALQEANFDPTVLVGSTLPSLDGRNFRPGGSNWLVVEACEYRENFRFLAPEILLLTNLEWDHADYFQTEEQYDEAFLDLAQKAKIVLYHGGDLGSLRLVERLRQLETEPKLIEISSKNPDWQLKIWGEANAENARLALGAGEVLGLDREVFISGLEAFAGAGRRQEFLGSVKVSRNGKNLEIFDDYGHHPTEITATIKAFRERFPQEKIGLIFEPHQYSRTRQFFGAFVTSFRLADQTALFPIFEARDSEDSKNAISLQQFLEVNSELAIVENVAEIEAWLKFHADLGVVVFMGAGNISVVARQYLRSMEKI